jgi:hypothetical protein
MALARRERKWRPAGTSRGAYMHIRAPPASSRRSCCSFLRSSWRRSASADAILHGIMGESCWNASRKSGHAIAKHVSVDDKTVAGWRAKICPTAEIPQLTKRKGAGDSARRSPGRGNRPERERRVPDCLDPSITGPVAGTACAPGRIEALQGGSRERQRNRKAPRSRSRHDRLMA